MSPEEREFLLGDMEEEYAELRRNRGRLTAWWWYWLQTARSALAAATPGRGPGRGPGRAPGGEDPASSPERRSGTASLLDSVLQDVRFALRTFRQSPGFTAVAIVSLALGIGASTAIFSVVHGVVLSSLPYPGADRLVQIKKYSLEKGEPDRGALIGGMSFLNFLETREHVPAFEEMALHGNSMYRLRGAEGLLSVRGAALSSSYFRFFGLEAALGRTLGPGDAERSVVLSHDLWRRAFAADPGIVGRTVRLDDESFVAVGVMPEGFEGVGRRTFDLWVPIGDLTHSWLDHRGHHGYGTFARLRADATIRQARSEVRLVRDRLAEAYPDAMEDTGYHVVSMHEEVVGPVRPTLLLLFTAVGLLLLIACANVANLLLARVTSRKRETALRRALGAGRGRIARQLLTESVLLGLLAGLVGALVAAWGVRVLVATGPAEIPRLDEVGVDGPVLAFALAASVLTALVFGLIPALRGSRKGMGGALRQAGKGQLGSGSGNKLRHGLVVAEVALALVLLTGAGLLVRSFVHLWTYAAGFEPEGVLTVLVDPYPDREAVQRAALFEEVEQRLAAHPEVDAVGGIMGLPVDPQGWLQVTIKGLGGEDGNDVDVRQRAVSGDYFRAMGIPLIAGTSLRDTSDPDGTVLLNVAAVSALWPGIRPENAVGRQVAREIGPSLKVVGVVGNTRHGGTDPEPRPILYGRLDSKFATTYITTTLVVRASGDPLDLAGVARATIADVDPEQPVGAIRTMEQVLDDSMARPRFYMGLFSLFGALAMVLAASGIFGLAAYSVSERVPEIGVRIALGARASDVLRLVVGRGMLLVGVGTAAGLGVAWAARQYVESLLHGIPADDPVTFAATPAFLMVVALLAFWIPARRATRVDPVDALRVDR